MGLTAVDATHKDATPEAAKTVIHHAAKAGMFFISLYLDTIAQFMHSHTARRHLVQLGHFLWNSE